MLIFHILAVIVVVPVSASFDILFETTIKTHNAAHQNGLHNNILGYKIA